LQGSSKITQRELHYLEDCLQAEEMAIRKCQAFAEAAQDPEVAEICKNMANKHLQHYNTLLQHLQSSRHTLIH
jgi:rubrerythrin